MGRHLKGLNFSTTIGAPYGLVYRLGAQRSCDIAFVRLGYTIVCEPKVDHWRTWRIYSHKYIEQVRVNI
ncbi:hypothetical protein Syun_004079 [Stephania yunnanensis]|uniref:Uncharacterized protein n=1 Tax=Stephania yunnanensis TaxID=152371 RepID=A0AAP0Q0F1_9MAGN